MDDATRRAGESGNGDESELRLTSYRPLGIDPVVWTKVRPFVFECAGHVPPAGWASGTRTVRVLSRLAAWAAGEGFPLEAEILLDPDTVERFIEDTPGSDASRATYRSVLRRIGPLLTTKAPWEPRSASVARRQIAMPYTSAELDFLACDALGQPTAAKMKSARALIALGAGAGLDGRWVARVRGSDVVEEDGVLLVRVVEPSARVIPVLATFEDEIVSLASTAGDQYLVGGSSASRNRTSHLTTGLFVPPGHPRVSPARLRSTWLLTHLTAGTRLSELAHAAGLNGVTVLSDLLAHVELLSEGESRRLLRDPRSR